MSFFQNKRTGITIQDNCLVICEVISDASRKRELNALNLVNISNKLIKQGRILDKKRLKKIILKALEDAKPNAVSSKEIVFEIPEEYSFQHILTLPASLSEEQVREAVVFQTEKLLPFDLDQMSWDVKIIPQTGQDNLILFTAVPLDLIEEYYEVFISCGLMPLGFSIRAEDLILAVAKSKKTPTVLIDLQNKYISVLFFQDGNLISLEQINIGEDDLKKAIAEKFELYPHHLNKQLRRMSSVDINLGALTLMKKVGKELKSIVSSFVKQEESLTARRVSEEPVADKVTEENKDDAKIVSEKKHTNVERHEELIVKKIKNKNNDALNKDGFFKDFWQKFKWKDLPKSSQVLKKDELKRSSSKARKSKDKKMDRYNFVFTGSSMFRNSFKEYLSKHRHDRLKPLETDIKKILGLEVRDQNRLSLIAKKDKKVLFKKILPGLIGASLSNYAEKDFMKKPINLLPPMVRSIALWKETSSWFYVSATLIVVMSIAWLMAFGFAWGNTTAQLKVARANFIMVERQLSTKKSTVLEGDIIKANEELKVLAELRASNTLYSDIMKAINDVLPDPSVFVSLKHGLHQDKTLFEWKGRVNSREEVIEIHELMSNLPFINKTIFPPSNLDTRDQIEFRILFNLKDVLSS